MNMPNEPTADQNAPAGDPAEQAVATAADEVVAAVPVDAPGEQAASDAGTAPAAAAAPRSISADLLERIVEGALLAAGKPLGVDDLIALFEDDERPTPAEIRAALAAIADKSVGRGFELREVASGFRFQVVQEVAPWIARLWEEKPQKYSRALLETLALIAYRQPITRGDIEDIRGVAVATNIIKTLLERDWVRVVGHKDVPGRPAMYATTRRFLDYFNLKNLDELPALADLRDLDALSAQLSIEGADTLLPEQQEAAGEGDATEGAEAPASVESAAPAAEESSAASDAIAAAPQQPEQEAVGAEAPAANEEQPRAESGEGGH